MRVHSPIDTSMPSIFSSAIHCFKLNAKQMERKKKTLLHGCRAQHERKHKEEMKCKRKKEKIHDKIKSMKFHMVANFNSYKLNSIHMYMFHLSIQDESFVRQRCDIFTPAKSIAHDIDHTYISIISLPSLDFKFVGNHSLSASLLFFSLNNILLALSSVCCTDRSHRQMYTQVLYEIGRLKVF